MTLSSVYQAATSPQHADVLSVRATLLDRRVKLLGIQVARVQLVAVCVAKNVALPGMEPRWCGWLGEASQALGGPLVLGIGRAGDRAKLAAELGVA